MDSPAVDPALPAIMWETGADEAFLIGSEGELRRFAHKILAMLDQQEEADEYLGVEVRWASEYLTEKFGDVRLVGTALTSNDLDTKRLINAVRENNGEPRIAVPGWPSEGE